MNNAMVQAVKLAKGFEGDWIARMKMALKDVWATIKKGEEIMSEMKGTEKQVAWANDIKKRVTEIHNWVMENATDVKVREKRPKAKEIAIEKMNNVLENDDAKFWIDNFKLVENTDKLPSVSAYFKGMQEQLKDSHFSQRNILRNIAKNADFLFMKQSNEKKKRS